MKKQNLTTDQYFKENCIAVKMDIDVNEVNSILVNQGLSALIFQKGKFVGELTSREYEFTEIKKSLFNFRRYEQTRVIFIRDDHFPLMMELRDKTISDGSSYNLVFGLLFCVSDKQLLNKERLAINESYSINDLKESIGSSIEELTEKVLNSINPLNDDFKIALENELDLKLNDRLEGIGIEFKCLSSIKIIDKQEEKIKQANKELSDKEIDLQAKREDDKLQLNDQNQRLEIYKQLLLNKNQKAMLEKLSEEKFNEFLNEIDKKHLIHEAERKELLDIIKYAEEDRVDKREYLKKKLKKRYEHELKMLELEQSIEKRKREIELEGIERENDKKDLEIIEKLSSLKSSTNRNVKESDKDMFVYLENKNMSARSDGKKENEEKISFDKIKKTQSPIERQKLLMKHIKNN